MDRFCFQRNLMIFFILCAGVVLGITPCVAGTKYFTGGPDLRVSLDATDELVPGTTVELPLLLENRGVITMEFANAFTLQPEYLPTTSMFTVVQLVPGDAPVKVKTKPQIVGEIASGMVVPASFSVEIPQDAKAGRYIMNAIVAYQYVPTIEQEGSADIEYYFRNEAVVRPVPIVIRPLVVLTVENVSSTRLYAGGEGYVTFRIRNTGQDTGSRTSVYLEPEGANPLTPFSNGVYIGDLPPGGYVEPRFKVAISENADPSQPCPVSLYAVYQDFEGNTITSPTVSTGVAFGEKVRFERTSLPSVIHAGETNIVSVTYKNTGTMTVYNAQARISVIDPFSSEDDTTYLGDMRPGDSVTALFSVKTDAGATVKTYSMDSEVGYTDFYQISHTSDNIPVILDVQTGSGARVIAAVLVLIAVIGGGVLLWFRKKKVADLK